MRWLISERDFAEADQAAWRRIPAAIVLHYGLFLGVPCSLLLTEWKTPGSFWRTALLTCSLTLLLGVAIAVFEAFAWWLPIGRRLRQLFRLDPRFVQQPAVGYEAGFPCAATGSGSSLVAGMLYVGRDDFVFAPHISQRRRAAAIIADPMDAALRIGPAREVTVHGAGIRRRWLGAWLFGGRYAEGVVLRWGGGAVFLRVPKAEELTTILQLELERMRSSPALSGPAPGGPGAV